ncbi:O-antigen ligase family protein [Patescibacteria group bacterium]|nr:O-antigen ligase family protein [Patescibacteria group bacterium]
MDSNNKWYKYYFYGFLAILALPVITTPAVLNPTAWGKAIIFRIILATLIFISIYEYKTFQTIIKKALSKGSDVFWPIWLLIGFLGLVILSTIFSLDPNFSFWGSPLRADGSLNYIFYILFAILTFLIIKKTDWEKIWKFNIIIGVLVSIIALSQKFGFFEKTVKTYDGRPPGTLGGPIFLALYLLLLIFITFSFFLKEKELKRKMFYLLTSSLFVYIILLTSSRAIWFGLFIGLVYFILTFPKKNKLILAIKISFLVLTILGACGIYYLNTNPRVIDSVFSRLSIKLAVDDPRFSAWVVSAEAIKDYPILGYGPENFSIAFDRYYNPSLPFISKEWGSWYDRAHNFIFEMGITYGIPALLIYLALIGVLFWKLQKIKYGPNTFIIHGIQATFFAYLSANIFSFDVFSTYLIFFLIIGYSLSLIQSNESN